MRVTMAGFWRGLAQTTWLLAGALALTLAGGETAQAQRLASLPKADTIGRIDPTGSAKPVRAWVSFCERYAAECEIDLAEPTTVELTPRLWRTLNAVNREINRAIAPTTDIQHWGVVDRWDIPTDGKGDCEDIQLLKRKTLVERYGLPRRALRMTVVIDEDGEGHAVLMVRTTSGELILDNKRTAILPWHSTGYVFVKREGQDGTAWVSLGDRAPPSTTANR